MKIRKPGQSRVGFGVCKSPETLLRYALLEGFYVGIAQCRCGFCWNMIISPERFKRKPRKGEMHSLPDQSCLECGRVGIHIRVRFIPS
jgi:hypothetical protein